LFLGVSDTDNIRIIVGGNKLYLYELYKHEEKRASVDLFLSFSKRVHLYVIFPDNLGA